MTLTLDREEEERITNIVEEAINSNSSSSTSSSLYPSLDEFLNDNSEKYEKSERINNGNIY